MREMCQLLGEIKLIAWDDIPVGWMRCEGQSLEMNKYPKLYMMIGSKFGQEGQFNFSLPDLRDKAPPGLVYCIATEGSIPRIRDETMDEIPDGTQEETQEEIPEETQDKRISKTYFHKI